MWLVILFVALIVYRIFQDLSNQPAKPSVTTPLERYKLLISLLVKIDKDFRVIKNDNISVTN